MHKLILAYEKTFFSISVCIFISYLLFFHFNLLMYYKLGIYNLESEETPNLILSIKYSQHSFYFLL